MRIFQFFILSFIFMLKIVTFGYKNIEKGSNFSVFSHMNESNGSENDDDYDDNSNVCSTDIFIDQLSEIILPKDYEENKNLDFNARVKHLNETIATFKRLHQYSQNVSEKLKPIIKRVMPRISQILLMIDLPPDCMASLTRISQSAQDREQWALKFFDSQPSISLKTSTVSTLPVGEYDQCLSIVSDKVKNQPIIKGQYCSLGIPNLLPPKHSYRNAEPIDQYFINLVNQQRNTSKNKQINPLIRKYFTENGKLYLKPEFFDELLDINDYLKTVGIKIPTGFCLPKTCNPKDIEYALNKLIYPITKIPLIINPDCDYVDKEVKLNEYQIIAIITFSLLAIIVLMGTIFDIMKNYKKISTERFSYISYIAKSFSIKTNFKKIFNTESANDKLSSLDGIRAILSFWVLIEHEYMSGLIPIHTKNYVSSASVRMGAEDKYMFLKNVNLVDTFFLIGGLMTCYVMLSKLEKSKGRFNYFKYVLFRYLRLLPPTVGSILAIYLFPLVGDGPFWKLFSDYLTIPCINDWKSNVFMLNNYDINIPKKFGCNLPTWYTAADFQLYLLAPIGFLALYHSSKKGFIWNIFLIFVGIFIALAPKLIFGIPHIFEFTKEESLIPYPKLMKYHFWGIESHIVSYILGLLLGYLIRRKPNLNFGGRSGELTLWIVSWSLTFYAIYWNKDLLNPYTYLSQFDIISWMVFSKLCYLSGWFYLIYCCTTGRAGFVNAFFGWNGFKPISNLSFEIYILHIIVVFYRVGSVRELIFYSNYYLFTIIPFDFLATVILSIIFYLLISGPFANLLNKYLQKKTKIIEINSINYINKSDAILSEKMVRDLNGTIILDNYFERL